MVGALLVTSLVGGTTSAAPPPVEEPTTSTVEVIGAPAPTSAVTPAPAPDAAEAAPCVPQQLSGVVDSLTLSDSTVGAYETIRADFAGHLPDGGCAGDFFTMQMPDDLQVQTGSFPVLAPDGSTIGTMYVDGTTGIVTVTFNSYIETHVGVTFSGYLSAALTEVFEPGHSYDLHWNVAGEAVTTPITIEECPDCQNPRTDPTKWAAYLADGTVISGLETKPAAAPGEIVTFTDTVEAGQEIDCDRISGFSAHSRTSSGSLAIDDPDWPVTIVSCDAGSLVATMVAADAGQYLGLIVYAVVTQSLTSYADHGTVTQAGIIGQVSATAVVFGGGVVGGGVTTTSTTTTTTTTTIAIVTTSASPTSTSTTSTVVQAEGPVGGSTSTTIVASPPPGTGLPITGTDSSEQVILALAAVVFGGIAVLVARRRRGASALDH